MVGGPLGHASDPGTPQPLRDALAIEFHDRGVRLAELYRKSARHAEVLFERGGDFWTIHSKAPDVPGWTQEKLDDWLFGDLVDVQLTDRLKQVQQDARP